MTINVSHVAKLTGLNIKEKDLEVFQKQLQEILNYIEKLNLADTKNIKETSQVTNLENVKREDETSPSLTQEEALSNSKSTQNGLFKVKGILNE